MDALLHDLRYAARTLLRAPAFALTAILTLALGMGAATAVFTLVNGVLLRPLPYRAPDRLAMVWTTGPDVSGPSGSLPLSAGNFIDLRRRTHAFESLAAFRGRAFPVSEGGETEMVDGVRTTAELFDVLGVRPALGRTFTAEEDRAGGPNVVVLGDALWRRKFGGSPSILGKQISLGAERYTVVGVMPKEFVFPRGAELPGGLQFAARTELWVPMAFTEREAATRGTLNLAAVGRLRPGVSSAAARSDLAAAVRAMAGDWPAFARGFGLRPAALTEQAEARVRAPLLVLMGAVAILLLIACVNVAHLLVARTVARRRELAIRGALGAGRGRLARQFVTENVLLVGAGTALGVLLAQWGVEAMLRLVPSGLPRADDVALDAPVAAVTAAVALGAGALLGLLAAFTAGRATLSNDAKATVGVGAQRFRRVLVTAEVALSFTLLIGAGLLAASFARLQRVPPGFEPRGAVAGGLLLPIGPDFDPGRDGPRWRDTFTRYVDQVRQLPGVAAAGGVSSLPLSGAVESMTFTVDGRPAPNAAEEPQAEYSVVTPDYFRAIGTPLLRGRAFADADRPDGAPTVIVNQALARRHFGGEDPLGRRISTGFERRQSREIVGVVGDVRQTALEAEAEPAMYFPLAQVPYPFLSIVVRPAAAGDLASLPGAMRRALREVDPALALSSVKALEDVYAESLARRRFSVVLIGLFAGAALSLAVVGLYGVIAYAVAQRTREIGVRVALGARPRDALRLVLRDGVRVTATGIAVGLAGALVLTRALRGQLYGVGPADPEVYGAVAVLLASVALFACYLPARRAARIEPAEALRTE